MPAIFKNCGPTSEVMARGKNMKLNSEEIKVESTGEADIGPELIIKTMNKNTFVKKV